MVSSNFCFQFFGCTLFLRPILFIFSLFIFYLEDSCFSNKFGNSVDMIGSSLSGSFVFFFFCPQFVICISMWFGFFIFILKYSEPISNPAPIARPMHLAFLDTFGENISNLMSLILGAINKFTFLHKTQKAALAPVLAYSYQLFIRSHL